MKQPFFRTAGAFLIVLILSVFAGGCAHHEPEPPIFASVPVELPPPPKLTYIWEPHLAPTGTLHIEIYPDYNRLLVYRNRIQIGASTLSAGKEGHATPPGIYKILQKSINHRSNLYGSFVDAATGTIVQKDVGIRDPIPPGSVFQGASMPYFMRLTNDGVGLHAGYLPGYNASHGCIRLPNGFVERLYAEVRIGTLVQVHNRTLAP
jgi:hypothetical protein